MEIFVGIDIVEVSKLKHWQKYSLKTLKRIFSQEEIEYCLSDSNKSAERFAVRFAAKEAFYKAISQIFLEKTPPLLFVMKNAFTTISKNGMPTLKFNKNKIKISEVKITLSTSHSNLSAIACVILYFK